MSETAIQIHGLGKQYRIGQRQRYKTFRETLTSMATAPFRKLARSKNGDSQSSFWALKDVSFEVQRGEVVGIIGRNGAGKSTLLKILSRITEPTEGRVEIGGRVGSLLEVGTGFHPELTGRENIYLNGAILGMKSSEIQRKFDEIVAFAETEKFLDTPVKHYSSGMYTRLAFAVAAHLEPEILVVDEVLAVGDVAFQRKCLGKMSEVAMQGRTVLFVSHNMSAVNQFCTRGVLLEQGKIKKIGSARDAVGEYLGDGGNSTAIFKVAEHEHNKEYDGTSNMQLLEVESLNACGGQFATFWRDPIRIRLRILVKRPQRNVILGFAVATPEGATLLSGHRYEGKNADEGATLEAGEIEVDLTMNNPLRPGRYAVDLGAHSAISREILFLVPRAAWLEVLEVSREGDPGPTQHRAYVNTECQWELRPSHP
jgi:ABC-type polysaccharide/polyol phosphate transport system ATPase subunit